MKIYMDVCCLNRPFDDQSQDKIRMESEAVLAILGRCQNGDWSLIGSDIINLEISQSKDIQKQYKVSLLHKMAKINIKTNPEIKKRAVQLQQYGIKVFDSLHLALAESACADVFLTTDRQLLNASGRSDIQTKVINPINWLLEVLSDE